MLTFFFFIGPIRDKLSQNVLDRSSPKFQDMYIITNYNKLDHLFAIAQGMLLW